MLIGISTLAVLWRVPYREREQESERDECNPELRETNLQQVSLLPNTLPLMRYCRFEFIQASACSSYWVESED